MLEHLLAFTLPAAYAILPVGWASSRATALLLAIGLQESGFNRRRQQQGPARGFWQFEEAGVQGVLEHTATQLAIASALSALQYDHTLNGLEILPALEHNDVLAACFARALIFTSHATLPAAGLPSVGWAIYTETWRPGRPRRSTWNMHYADAWAYVLRPRITPLNV